MFKKEVFIFGLVSSPFFFSSSKAAGAEKYFIKFSKPLYEKSTFDEKAELRDLDLTHEYTFQFSPIHIVTGHLEVSEINKLNSNSKVDYIEKVPEFFKNEVVPNDKSFSKLWGLSSSSGEFWGVDAPKAWEETTGDRSVKVCVIDSGIDYSHPDLESNIWSNPGETGLDSSGIDKSQNGIDDDGNGLIDDFRGWDFANSDNDPMDDDEHGTHVAGTIGGVGNNKVGISGVNWKVSLIPVKTLKADGGGSYADAMKGIEYCVNTGAKVSNNSYGGSRPSQAFDELMDWVATKDHLFVSSAGNSAANNDEDPNFPASYEHDFVLSVGASTKGGERSGFSNFGLESVDVFAPGDQILSTVPNGGYKFFEGTSMASPHVAGAAVLYLSKYPDKSAIEVKAEILKTAKKSASLIRYAKTSGILNLYNLIEEDHTPPSAVKDLVLLDKTYLKAKLKFQASGDDGKKGRASYYQYFLANEDIDGKINEFKNLQALKETYDPKTNEITAVLGGFASEAKGKIYVAAYDNKNQESKLSKGLPIELEKAEEYQRYDASNFSEISLDAPWALEEKNGEMFISDSPGGLYDNYADVSFELPSSSYHEFALIEVSLIHSLEKDYDFLSVEAKDSNSNIFYEIGKISGYEGLTTYHFDLLGSDIYRSNSETLTYRLRLTSDSVVNSDGVYIKSIRLLK